MARLIGRDEPNRAGQYLDLTSREIEKQRKIIASGWQNLSRASEQVTQGGLDVNQIQVAEAQADLIEANANVKKNQQFWGGVGSLVETGAKLFSKQDTSKELRNRDIMQATKEIGELSGRSYQVLKEKGITGLYRERDNILRKYDYLTSEDITKFYKESNSAINQSRKELFNTQTSEVEKLRDQVTQAQLSGMEVTAMTITKDLRKSRPENLGSVLSLSKERFFNLVNSKKFEEATPEFFIQAEILFNDAIREGLSENSDLYEPYQKQAIGLNELLLESQRLRAMNLSPTQEKAALLQKRLELGLEPTFASFIDDPTYNMQQQLREYEQEDKLADYYIKNDETLKQQNDEISKAANYMAVGYYLFNEDEYLKLISDKELFPPERVELIERQAKRYKDTHDNAATRQKQIIQYSRTLAQLEQKFASTSLSFKQKDVISAYDQLNSITTGLSTLIEQGVFGNKDRLPSNLLGQIGKKADTPEMGIDMTPEEERQLQEATLNAIRTEMAALGQLQEIINEEDAVERARLKAAGLNVSMEYFMEDVTSGKAHQRFQQMLQGRENYRRQLIESKKNERENFSYGSQGNYRNPKNADLLSKAFVSKNFAGQDKILPFEKPKYYAVTDGRSGSESAKRTNRSKHIGTDYGIPEGTKLLSLVHGEVVKSEFNAGGYGYYITIKGNDGFYYRYGHNKKNIVKVGDKVTPGMVIGLSGNTGRSSGAHLHFEVLKSNSYGKLDQTLNPETFLVEAYNKLKEGTIQQPRRNNIPDYDDVYKMLTPNQKWLLDQGGTVYKDNLELRDGRVIPLNQAYNTAKPIEQSMASIRKQDYKKGTDSSYGYKVLASDEIFRRELHKVADRLDIPAVWLADIMAVESGFDPTIQNKRSLATGLIQFIPSTAEGLGTSIYQLKKMSRVEQLKYVEAYFKDIMSRNGALNTLPEVVIAVYGGDTQLRKWRENPQEALKTRDKYIDLNVEQHLRKIGKSVGRQYEIPGVTDLRSQTGVYHTRYTSACSVCAKLQDTISSIVPHKAPVA